MTTSQQVNRIGKYLYRNIDGAFKYKVSSNTFDVYMTLYYQLERKNQDYTRSDDYNDLHEIVLDINITTYRNKIRVNVIEVSPLERTIGYDLYEPDILKDLEYAKGKIFERIDKRIRKAYTSYEILY